MDDRYLGWSACTYYRSIHRSSHSPPRLRQDRGGVVGHTRLLLRVRLDHPDWPCVPHGVRFLARVQDSIRPVPPYVPASATSEWSTPLIQGLRWSGSSQRATLPDPHWRYQRYRRRRLASIDPPESEAHSTHHSRPAGIDVRVIRLPGGPFHQVHARLCRIAYRS